jgi:hypothetical protein
MVHVEGYWKVRLACIVLMIVLIAVVAFVHKNDTDNSNEKHVMAVVPEISTLWGIN